MKYFDINNKELKQGDIINIHQTVNGQNLFVILSIIPLYIVYEHDLNYTYQYDMHELLAPCKYTGETTFEIVGNINDNIFFN